MPENGVSLRYIQELLEHNSSITFEIYTQMTYVGIKNVSIPLDHLTYV
ncbi:MAG: hypothetical protein IH947_11425 [Bacteroidetes bacterium]|nr:hypothetical protein [Bacteroidota bacterium]